jgi:hypothetical protein
MATAATITVTTNNPNIIADGQCSLIEAINNANNDVATFPDCAAGSGPDTIVLPANANLTLSSVYTRTYGQVGTPVGLPTITSQITIEGNGATIARQGNAPAFRIMHALNSGNLTLQRVTLSGGASFGGLSSSIGGTVSIKNSIISGNTGSGVSNWYGTLTIENSTISGNRADRGGGISNVAGSLTITNSTISGNAANDGGGVLNAEDCRYLPFFPCSPATLTINNSLIAGNEAAVAPEIANTTIRTANNFNLFGTNGNGGVTGFTPGPTDIVSSVSLAQILAPLSNNGGPTQTHALVNCNA